MLCEATSLRKTFRVTVSPQEKGHKKKMKRGEKGAKEGGHGD